MKSTYYTMSADAAVLTSGQPATQPSRCDGVMRAPSVMDGKSCGPCTSPRRRSDGFFAVVTSR